MSGISLPVYQHICQVSHHNILASRLSEDGSQQDQSLFLQFGVVPF